MPKVSLARSAARVPRHTTMPYRTMVATAPMSPSSSPMMLKMKSVWASGRKKSFCRLSPRPRPKKPPEPIEMSDSATW